MPYVKLTEQLEDGEKAWYWIDYYQHKMSRVTDPELLEKLKTYNDGKFETEKGADDDVCVRQSKDNRWEHCCV